MRLPNIVISLSLALLPTVAVPASLAMAQGSAAGNYDATFEEVADNCKGVGVRMSQATVTVSQRGKDLIIKIEDLPELKGSAGRKGKLRAKGEGPAKSPGVSAKYVFNGRTEDQRLQAVFVAEYFRGGKPICTQSFSVDGKRKKF